MARSGRFSSYCVSSNQFHFKNIYLVSHFQTHKVFIINERGEVSIGILNESQISTDDGGTECDTGKTKITCYYAASFKNMTWPDWMVSQ